MEFKLRLVADRPTDGELVLEPETPLSGLAFIETVGKTLRKSIDHVSRAKHTTLGALVTYEVTVPQAIAIESGKFEESDTYTVVLENNLLSHFVFYCADVVSGPAGRRCYPFTDNEATLVSRIDELAFLDAWATAGYASRLMMNGNTVVNGEFYANWDSDNTGSGSGTGTGGIGCGGCTCGKDDVPTHGCGHHHHHHHNVPPRPPVIGNSSGHDQPFVI